MYRIPENWNEVTLGMLINCSELSDLLPEAPIISIVSAYCGIPVAELKSSKALEVQEILDIMTFIYEEYHPSPKNVFTFSGITYLAKEDLSDQSFEDWVSIQTIEYNYRNNPVKGLPKLLATYCKQESETLDSFNLKERSELFSLLPMTIARDIESFFLARQQAYKGLIQLSSIIQDQQSLILLKLQDLITTMKQRKAQSGIFSGMRLRIGIYLLQLRWVRKELLKYFNSTPIKP
jgi:hypothetical protein